MNTSHTKKLMAVTTLLSAFIVVGTTVRAQLSEDGMDELPTAPLGEPMWPWPEPGEVTGAYTEESAQGDFQDLENMPIPSFPTEVEQQQQYQQTEPEIGNGASMDSGMPNEEVMMPAAEEPTTMETEEESSQDPFGGKSFYRAGTKVEVNTEEPSMVEPSEMELPAAPEEPVVEEVLEEAPIAEEEVIPLPEVPETVPEAAVVEEESMLSSLLGNSVYLFGAIALLVGGTVFFVFGRKKKKIATDGPQPTAQTIAQAAESASPRLAQALKALEAEESGNPPAATEPAIPQEGTSGPSA